MTQSQAIDLNLVEQVVERVPKNTWLNVQEAIVVNLVDYMPDTVLLRLTGEADGFERAEEILYNYYTIPGMEKELIIDAFKILGEENTLYLLDALQLDKIQPPSDEVP
jgi:hypothetical protein